MRTKKSLQACGRRPTLGGLLFDTLTGSSTANQTTLQDGAAEPVGIMLKKVPQDGHPGDQPADAAAAGEQNGTATEQGPSPSPIRIKSVETWQNHLAQVMGGGDGIWFQISGRLRERSSHQDGGATTIRGARRRSLCAEDEITGTNPNKDSTGDKLMGVPARGRSGMAIGKVGHIPRLHHPLENGGRQTEVHANGGTGSSRRRPCTSTGSGRSTETGYLEGYPGQHPRQDLLTLLQYVEEDLGGDVDESTQEGECKASHVVKEAVLREILQHTLAVHASGSSESRVSLAEDELETLQALLEAAEPTKNQGRNSQTPTTQYDEGQVHLQQRGTPGEAMQLGENTTARHEGAAMPVVQFIRRQRHGDALRIAASVFATVGVVETQAGTSNESVLIRAIAGEVHAVARHLLNSPPHLEQEGESLLRGTKRLLAGEVVQWEQQACHDG